MSKKELRRRIDDLEQRVALLESMQMNRYLESMKTVLPVAEPYRVTCENTDDH